MTIQRSRLLVTATDNMDNILLLLAQVNSVWLAVLDLVLLLTLDAPDNASCTGVVKRHGFDIVRNSITTPIKHFWEYCSKITSKFVRLLD